MQDPEGDSLGSVRWEKDESRDDVDDIIHHVWAVNRLRPRIRRLEQYRRPGLVIVAVDLQEPDGAVLDFADEFGIAFPLVIDRDGELDGVWRLGGPIEGIPTSYFLDVTGVIRELFYGPMTEELLEERLAEILPQETD